MYLQPDVSDPIYNSFRLSDLFGSNRIKIVGMGITLIIPA